MGPYTGIWADIWARMGRAHMGPMWARRPQEKCVPEKNNMYLVTE